MENQCDMVRSVSIIFPTKTDQIPFNEKNFKNFKKGVIIPKNSVETFSKENIKINIQKAISIPIQIIARPNADIKRIKISTSGFSKIANIKKIEKIDIQNGSIFELPFVKTGNRVISYLPSEKESPKTDEEKFNLLVEDGEKKSDVENAVPEIFSIDDYGCTLSEDDFNLIESSEEGDEKTSGYFEDYGIDNFYALSTERSETVQCNPTEVIIGSDVSLKDASNYPDDLKMYFFSSLADKESPLHASNLSSILISKVLKNLEFAMPKAKRRCESR